jgi:hypothetical protein
MGGLYDILEAYRQQNDPRFIYEGLYEEPAYTGPNIDPMYNLGARQFGNMNRMDFGVPQQATGIMQQAPLQNLGIDTSYGVANEEDVEQEFLPDQKKSSGLADLFRTLIGFAVPGAGLLMNLGRDGMGGIKSLNQRIRNTDFAKSSSLADYFDARSYGGRDARDRAASQNMREARAIQRQVDMRPSATPTNQDRGRGQSFSAPTRSAATTRSRDLGSMRGGVGR